jgi:hypothetical protein
LEVYIPGFPWFPVSGNLEVQHLGSRLKWNVTIIDIGKLQSLQFIGKIQISKGGGPVVQRSTFNIQLS